MHLAVESVQALVIIEFGIGPYTRPCVAQSSMGNASMLLREEKYQKPVESSYQGWGSSIGLSCFLPPL